jgi:hypothetical protein
MRHVILAVLAAIALAACAASPMQTTFDPPYPERNGDGDPILASFEGRIPCEVERCDKLKVSLVLYHDARTKAPSTYWLGIVPGVADAQRAATTGTWTMRKGVAGYPDATVYVLDANADSRVRHFWAVDEDILLVLDADMRPKVGTAAWGYMLGRDTRPYGPRTYVYDERERRFTGEMR